MRARLLEAVTRWPGLTIQGAAERAGVPRTTAAHHLRALAREGRLARRAARKSVHFYPNDGLLTESQQEQLQALAGDATRRVARLIARRPGAQRSELASLLGHSIATVNWHLRPLARSGLVRETAEGRRRRLFATDALAQALDLLEHGPPPRPEAEEGGVDAERGNERGGAMPPEPGPGMPGLHGPR